MKLVQVFCLVCFLTIAAFAQAGDRIEGKVIPPKRPVTPILPDPPDPIRNATLKLINSSDKRVVAETRTDDGGNFVFENVPKGNYSISGLCSYCASGTASTEIFY